MALIPLAISGPKPDSLSHEWAVALIQAVVVLGLGAVFTFTIDRYQDAQAEAEQQESRERDKRLREDELVRGTLVGALDGYHRIKQARRLLRAQLHADAEGDRVNVTAYDEHMASVSLAQLNFEGMAMTAELLRAPLSTILSTKSKEIEHILGEFITEYEKQRRFVAFENKQGLGDLPLMNAFIARRRERVPTGSSRLETDGFDAISKPLKEIITALRTQLLEPFEFTPKS